MAKIVISDLHPTDVEAFLHDLTSAEMDAVLGGYEISLLSFEDDVNPFPFSIPSLSNLFSADSNKILTTDFSGVSINMIALI